MISFVVIVQPSVQLGDVIDAAANLTDGNTTTVLYLHQGVFQLNAVQSVTSQLALFGGDTLYSAATTTTKGNGFSRQLHQTLSGSRKQREPEKKKERPSKRRELFDSSYTIIDAASNSRHIILTAGTLQTSMIVLRGSQDGSQYFGRIEILGSNSSSTFSRTDFVRNRWSSTGGALVVQNGASSNIGR